MARRHRQYDDDDGRTIFDMSYVRDVNVVHQKANFPEVTEEDLEGVQPPPEPIMDKDEQRWFIFGALKATMLIAMVYIVGLSAVVALMLALWAIF